MQGVNCLGWLETDRGFWEAGFEGINQADYASINSNSKYVIPACF